MTQGNLSKLLARAVPRKFAKLKSLQRHIPRSGFKTMICGVAAKFFYRQGVRVAAISAAISEREHNAADRKKSRNPLGGSYFDQLQRWLDSQSPLRGFSCLAALDSAEITFRATHHSFETTSRAEKESILLKQNGSFLFVDRKSNFLSEYPHVFLLYSFV